MDNRYIEPFIKWAGGKRQLLNELIPLVPNYTGKYIEPFLGGGALFFALNPPNAVIADYNEELINLYRVVAEDPEGIIKKLKQYKNSKEEYYRIRTQNWKDLSKIDAAARTLFLNKTGFNGLYRVNKQGYFNVPYGNKERVTICNAEQIRRAASCLQKQTILCSDYRKTISNYAEKGDFVFLDPPYYPSEKKENFLRYTAEKFDITDQEEMAGIVNSMYDRGCNVIMTNSNHPRIHELYKRFLIKVVPVRRSVNCRGNGRTGEDAIIIAVHT